MSGDQADIIRRIKTALPVGWFPDVSPVLDSTLAGIGSAWAWVYDLLDRTSQQTRVSSASDVWLDLISTDYFGQALLRHSRESDEHYRERILSSLLREKSTRSSLQAVLRSLTGRTPKIFEPGRCADTGGYGVARGMTGGLGYNVSGGWGNLNLPYQCFVTAYRPAATGISVVTGFNCSGGGYGVGCIEYANLDLMEDRISDTEILSAISATLPVATIAWTRITD